MPKARYEVVDADGFQSALMFENTRVGNAAVFATSASLAHKLYTDYGNPPPPMPDKLRFPCSMRVTERHNTGTGERIGRVQFLHLDSGAVLFDESWTVAEARKF
jgi:hypothetical protein